MGRIGGLEQAFADVENAADAALKSASALTKLAKDLQKAAKEGNIAAIKRLQSRLGDSVGAVDANVSAAAYPSPSPQRPPCAAMAASASPISRTVSRKAAAICM